ncbi:DUF5906 domain-containing protein [Mesorhizobium sp. M0030]|uniref:DUF5906 domain-containing protein n=1 Tax=Mesorhizobium sp. M0030 TaxID=2956851 RepID=UPI0033390A6F
MTDHINLTTGVINPPAQSFEQASTFVNAITGGQAATAIIDWRAIHDANKSVAAIPFRDTLQNAWSSIVHYNNQGYGIFAVIAELDGVGRELCNVQSLRANYVDLDNLSAQQNLTRAEQWFPAPAFAVNSSPQKFHIYWPVQPYTGNERFELIQRKLKQFFEGDPSIIDATRVMRLPGTISTKYSNPQSSKHTHGAAPHLVTCFAMAGNGYVTTAEQLETALHDVNVIDGGGGRHQLGDPALAAPSLHWLQYALDATDPNTLSRGDWISFLAAVKQAGWTLASDQQLYDMWQQWCMRYDGNDPGENYKQWNSIRNTEVGWPAVERRIPTLRAQRLLGGSGNAPAVQLSPTQAQFGEMLTPQEQRIWFNGCVLIGPENCIIGPRGIRYGVGSFNASYGGKRFIIDSNGKTTDEAWQAATRSRVWTVPKVDGTCFRPDMETGDIIRDGLGRSYVNTYVPANIQTLAGDPAPFLRHLALVLPNADDQHMLLEFLAHNAKYPGHKIPWSPVLQSVEGVGKNVFKQVMRHVIDKQYFYQPKAKQLNESGSKFNGWMGSKLFFLVDEIRTDEKRDMVETLKPFITETELEIEGKGVDQKMGDTPSNWLFFSNYKDAIPVTANGRRFAIFYSPIQTVDDLRSRGMDDAYFNSLYNWLGDHPNGGGHKMGLKIVAHYLLNYPIERGAISKRAPVTSSTAEALIESRGWLEQLLAEAVEDASPGFRGGWISTAAVGKLLGQRGHKAVPAKTLATAISAVGYFRIGQSGRAYFQDDLNKRGVLWNLDANAHVENYGRAQGYD